MVIHLFLTEDDLKLISLFNIESDDDDYLKINKNVMLMNQTHILDDVALVLGLKDRVIKGTEEDALGGAYPDEVEKYMLDTYNYVKKNMFLIETLLHQKVASGIKPGHYRCFDNDLIWTTTYEISDFDEYKDEDGNYDFTKCDITTKEMREFTNDMKQRPPLDKIEIKIKE